MGESSSAETSALDKPLFIYGAQRAEIKRRVAWMRVHPARLTDTHPPGYVVTDTRRAARRSMGFVWPVRAMYLDAAGLFIESVTMMLESVDRARRWRLAKCPHQRLL